MRGQRHSRRACRSRRVGARRKPRGRAGGPGHARRNRVADQLEVRLSDVFDAIDPAADGPFDVGVFDPPFRWFQPHDLLEMATADPSYRALTRFMREARLHLSDRGRLLVFFGSSGDLDYLQRLVAEEGFGTEVLARKTLVEDGWQVEYITYRLTPYRFENVGDGTGDGCERPLGSRKSADLKQ
jgi:release factor glutamine methyltransferase